MTTEQAQNTDKEIWRRVPGDFYSPSIHVTQSGSIGVNVGGHVFVAPVERWHEAMRLMKGGGWISVKERLPELTCRDDSHVPGGAPATLYSERVLVFDGTVRIDNLIQAEGEPETTTFYVGTDEPITHWMPLPSPPSKAEGE